MTQSFFSCDWGTTSFRLRLAGPEETVISEIRESVGAKALFEQALERGEKTEAGRAGIFADFLRRKLEELPGTEAFRGARPPLVISGMASSTIGWKELPYAKTPVPLDGRGLHIHTLEWNSPPWLGPTFLVSGIATKFDIMRGEETEIIGLLSDAPEGVRERALLILPGTHSKHVSIVDHKIQDFRTYMTGELFEVLGRQSILRASVDLDHLEFSEVNKKAFCEGATWGAAHGIAAGLFRVRTREVLAGARPGENTWFLSGLLMGAELENLTSALDRPVLLASGRAVSHLYSLAIKTLAPKKFRWQELSPEAVERATIRAHAQFLKNISEPLS